MNVIEIKNLHKAFGNVKAVNDLNFSVKKGELFAFLGENGAGKSTTISIMCGLLKKDSGEVFICGENQDTATDFAKRKLGVVFQNSVLDAALTVKDNLKTKAALYGITGNAFDERLSYLAERLDFERLLSRTVGKLSGGERRRIDIARALLHEPEILILDEPTTGLDPQTRKLLWDVITELRKNTGLTVFLTTHYMEEAADADYVVILDSGKIAASGTPLELKSKYTGDFILIYNIDEEQVKQLNKPYSAINNGFKVTVASTLEATKLITEFPNLFCDYEIIKGKMDDVFLNATGKKLDGGKNDAT